jgi:hypothetical protein
MNRAFSHIIYVTLALGLLAWSCTPTSITQSTSKKVDDSYQDDASKYRPSVSPYRKNEGKSNEVIDNEPIISKYAIDAELDTVMNGLYMRNDSIRLWDGYTILVYSGNNELEAGRVRNRLFDLVPNQEAQFSYKLPTYFVKIGQFVQQVEALPLLKDIQRNYPSAAIVPEKFPIEKNDSGEN